ncbi:MAG: FliH/SctL family protein [Gemmatimonadaceae bacterium]
MSLSESDNRQQVSNWALDEFEMPDIFEAPMQRAMQQHAEAHASAEPAAEQVITSPQELARIEAAAYAHGRADGEKMAWNELLPRIESVADALAGALEDVRLHQQRWTSNAEENLAVLAVAVARQLIAREVETDAGIVAGLVQRALAQFPLEQQVSVRLHPDDVDSCTELLQPAEGNKFHEIRWIADSQVHRGGCMVEGRERIVDGRVDTALERVYRSIGNVQAT